MIQYATPAELAAYLDPDAEVPAVPPLATVLLRTASQLVLDASAAARYRTDAEGLPTDAATLTTLKEATMEQASAWSLNGIDPRKGASQVSRRVQSKAVTGVSVTYVADPAADTYLSDLAAGDALTAAALTILSNGGMLSNRVNTGGGGTEYFNVQQRYYDPLTGDLP